MAFFVAVLLSGFALWFKGRISVDNPGKLQLLLETVVGALKDMLLDNVGTKGRPFLGPHRHAGVVHPRLQSGWGSCPFSPRRR